MQSPLLGCQTGAFGQSRGGQSCGGVPVIGPQMGSNAEQPASGYLDRYDIASWAATWRARAPVAPAGRAVP